MTRAEQIQSASDTYLCGDKSYTAVYEEKAFTAGAEWADKNPHWISVYDQLPPYNEKVLVFYGVDRYIGIAMLENVFGQQTFWSDGRKAVSYITHWMPLPAQPKEGGKQ